MTVLLKAITPKRFLEGADKQTKKNLKAAMVLYTDTVAEIMRTYPPEIPLSSSGRKRRARGSVQTARIQAELRGERLPGLPRRGRYRRTGNLGRAWTTAVNSDGSRGLVLVDPSSKAFRYAVFVQGPLHKGPYREQTSRSRKAGWTSITTVARTTRKQFETIMNRAIIGGVTRRELITHLQ